MSAEKLFQGIPVISNMQIAGLDIQDPLEHVALQERQAQARLYHPLWMGQATAHLTNAHDRFHYECLDFTEWVRVHDFTPQETLFTKLQTLIR